MLKGKRQCEGFCRQCDILVADILNKVYCRLIYITTFQKLVLFPSSNKWINYESQLVVSGSRSSLHTLANVSNISRKYGPYSLSKRTLLRGVTYLHFGLSKYPLLQTTPLKGPSKSSVTDIPLLSHLTSSRVI